MEHSPQNIRRYSNICYSVRGIAQQQQQQQHGFVDGRTVAVLSPLIVRYHRAKTDNNDFGRRRRPVAGPPSW